jgi:O-antigen ligase/tetratricopeptide (TPR) repeat protein
MHQPTASWGARSQPASGAALPSALLRVVDAGLCGVIFVAPYFFGGRHDLGRLVFVSIVAVTAVAWFLRQALLPAARWPRTAAHGLLLLAAALVALQIVPLPADCLAKISPRTAQLLPLWTSGSDANTQLGTWQTISVAPHETTKALAMLLSYGLLFLVASGRIQDHTDVRRLLTWMGIAAAAMALFGLAQYATSDGKFFWFYDHPHRTTTQALSGPFINRNHFASFLVMGLGPLVALLLLSARTAKLPARTQTSIDPKRMLVTWTIAAAIALIVACILLSRSRGGAVAMLIAGAVLALLLVSRRLADRRIIYCCVGLAVAVAGLLALHGGDNALDRLDDFADASFENVDRDGIRRKLWSANVDAFQAGWLTGAGVGTHREFCPVYLPRYYTKEYTHAESGYLQIASEAGIGGVVLLAAALALIAAWCARAWRGVTDERGASQLAATSAGLAATAAHSVVDFVWYIPACMSLVIILAACALRLAQLSAASDERPARERNLRRGRWLELATAAILVGGWSVATYVGPGIAAVHWNRYLRASVAHSEAARQPSLAAGEPAATDRAALNDLMLRELELVVKWDPKFARAHLKLVARLIARFDLEQQSAENAISLTNLCDAISQSQFETKEAMVAWLEKAVGKNLQLLRQAANEARIAVALTPLRGEAYVYLARLAFLDGKDAVAVRAYTNQALLVRPHSAEVLFEIGREERIANKLDAALARWQQCFDDPGPHQLKIIHLVAGDIPAAKLLDVFHPDWPLLRNIWSRYRAAGSTEDLDALLTYSLERTRQAADSKSQVPPAFAWYWQSQLFAEVGQTDHALACLQQAHSFDARQYSIRYALAKSLQASGRYDEAEPHYRWCLARRPMDKSLTAGLVAIAKARFAERSSIATTRPIANQSGGSSSSSNSPAVPR